MQTCLSLGVNNQIEEQSNMIQDIVQHSKDDRGQITQLLNVARPRKRKLDTNNTLLVFLKESIPQPSTIHTSIEEALAQHMVTLDGKLCELHTLKETILLVLTTFWHVVHNMS